ASGASVPMSAALMSAASMSAASAALFRGRRSSFTRSIISRGRAVPFRDSLPAPHEAGGVLARRGVGNARGLPRRSLSPHPGSGRALWRVAVLSSPHRPRIARWRTLPAALALGLSTSAVGGAGDSESPASTEGTEPLGIGKEVTV